MSQISLELSTQAGNMTELNMGRQEFGRPSEHATIERRIPSSKKLKESEIRNGDQE